MKTLTQSSGHNPSTTTDNHPAHEQVQKSLLRQVRSTFQWILALGTITGFVWLQIQVQQAMKGPVAALVLMLTIGVEIVLLLLIDWLV